jgi:hypothetical protein
MASKAKPAATVSTQSQGDPAAAAGTKPASARPWTVTLPYVPSTVVPATDEAEAWEKFKEKWGIVKSEHVPVITSAEDQK